MFTNKGLSNKYAGKYFVLKDYIVGFTNGVSFVFHSFIQAIFSYQQNTARNIEMNVTAENSMFAN